ETVITSIASVDDVAELHEFMLDEFLHESLNAAIALTREEATQCYRDLIEHCVASGFSCVQRNSEGRIVGMNMSSVVDYGVKTRQYYLTESKYPTRVQLSVDLLEALNENKWAGIPADVEQLLYIEIVCVSPQYRNCGLAQKLLDLSYKKARAAGASGAFAECTALPSQKLFGKTGYRVVQEINLDEYLGEDGKPIFECSDGTTTAQLVFKRL
ncbi:hypothetical protein PMAYCL1PPCAC_13873, partial [Pristionchus mayeri]